jgi:hypothetical protein
MKIDEIFRGDDRILYKQYEENILELSRNIDLENVNDLNQVDELSYEVFIMEKWKCIIKHLNITNNNILEIAAGENDILVRVMTLLARDQVHVDSISNNIELNRVLKKKVSLYDIDYNIINCNIFNYKSYNKYGLVFLSHVINDIVEYIVCSEENIDLEKQRINSVKKIENTKIWNEIISQKIQVFIQLIHSLMQKNSYLVANHCIFKSEKNLGYNDWLNKSYLNLFRKEVYKSNLFTELDLKLQKDWFIVLKRI